jgi:hypothetical protein
MSNTLVSTNTSTTTSQTMFTHGIACQTILVLHAVGLLPILEKRAVKKEEITKNERFPQPMSITGAFQALTYADIVKYEDHQYVLTEFGGDVVKNIDIFIHWYNAYGGLMAKLFIMRFNLMNISCYNMKKNSL